MCFTCILIESSSIVQFTKILTSIAKEISKFIVVCFMLSFNDLYFVLSQSSLYNEEAIGLLVFAWFCINKKLVLVENAHVYLVLN